MGNTGVVRLDLDAVLKVLFCCYAFSMPFELLFEILFNVETIFKPFRIFGLGILFFYGIKVIREGLVLEKRERTDLFLYASLIYGIIISCFRIIGGPFNMAFFYNDLFLVGLNFSLFFVFKNLNFSGRDLMDFLMFFVIGFIVNGLYIYYGIHFAGAYSRQAGFLDNPNYMALGVAVSITYFLLRSNYTKSFLNQLLYIVIIVFLLYIFMITGSRTGLIILALAIMIVFFFSSIYRKILVTLAAIAALVFAIPSNFQEENLGSQMLLLKRVNKKLNDEEVDVRFVIWKGVFNLLEDEGYLGMGIGQFKENFDKYFTNINHEYIIRVVDRGYFLSTHNEYLAILTDYGFPALLFYLCFLAINLFWLLSRVIKPPENGPVFIEQFKFILLSCLIIFGMAAENLPNPIYFFLLMVATKRIDYERIEI